MDVDHRNGFTCEDAEDRISDLEARAEAAEQAAVTLRERVAEMERTLRGIAEIRDEHLRDGSIPEWMRERARAVVEREDG